MIGGIGLYIEQPPQRVHIIAPLSWAATSCAGRVVPVSTMNRFRAMLLTLSRGWWTLPFLISQLTPTGMPTRLMWMITRGFFFTAWVMEGGGGSRIGARRDHDGGNGSPGRGL